MYMYVSINKCKIAKGAKKTVSTERMAPKSGFSHSKKKLIS